MDRMTEYDIVELRRKGLTYRKIAERVGVSIWSVWKALKDYDFKKVVKYVD